MNHSRSRAKVSGAGLLTAATAITATVIATQQPAAAEGPAAVTENICGNVCGGDAGGHLDKILPLENAITFFNASPLHLGINESCGFISNTATQAGHFNNFLNNRNSLYYGSFRPQVTAGDLCDSNTTMPFGVGDWISSTESAPNVDSGAFSYQVAGDESRGWICINGGINTPKFWGCSAHMNNTNPGSSVTGAPAERQFANYWQQIKARSSKAVYWGGDMYVYVNEMPNIPPDSGSAFSFTSNQEADLCYDGTYRWTHRNKISGVLSKFDYVLRSGPNQTSCPGDALLQPSNSTDMYPVGTWESDHRILWGGQPCC